MTEHPTSELHADARAHFMATMRFEHEQGDEEALGRATVGVAASPRSSSPAPGR